MYTPLLSLQFCMQAPIALPTVCTEYKGSEINQNVDTFITN